MCIDGIMWCHAELGRLWSMLGSRMDCEHGMRVVSSIKRQQGWAVADLIYKHNCLGMWPYLFHWSTGRESTSGGD